jgi:hypothetical protein
MVEQAMLAARQLAALLISQPSERVGQNGGPGPQSARQPAAAALGTNQVAAGRS